MTAEDANGVGRVADQIVEKSLAIGRVLQEIKDGGLDDRLSEFTEAIRLRQESRKEEVAALVREVFGSDAEIVVPEPLTPLRRLFAKTEDDAPRKNPFEEKAEREDGDGEEVKDGLADPKIDDLEAKMEAEIASHVQPEPSPDYLPPEQRGAIISGLRPSDMGG